MSERCGGGQEGRHPSTLQHFPITNDCFSAAYDVDTLGRASDGGPFAPLCRTQHMTCAPPQLPLAPAADGVHANCFGSNLHRSVAWAARRNKICSMMSAPPVLFSSSFSCDGRHPRLSWCHRPSPSPFLALLQPICHAPLASADPCACVSSPCFRSVMPLSLTMYSAISLGPIQEPDFGHFVCSPLSVTQKARTVNKQKR